MLERYTESHVARRRRRLGPATLFSIAAHVAAVVGLLMAAGWRIDKLDTAEPPVLLASMALPAPAGPEEAPAARPKPPRKAKGPKVARDPTQPTRPTEAAAPSSGREPGPSQSQDGPTILSTCAPGQPCVSDVFAEVPEPVCGDGAVEGGEECDDGGLIGGDGCSAECKHEPKMVDARLIEGHRVAGDPQIAPPPEVQRAMLHRGQREVRASFRMCLDRAGAVHSVRVQRPTGHQAYDQLLISRMQSWRYQPYRTSAGSAVPVCTSVTFIYRID